MKYLMREDKKGRLVVTEFGRIDKLFKSSDKFDKQELLETLRRKVDSKICFSQFEIREDTIFITCLKYSRYGELIRQAEIVLSDDLAQDTEFVDTLTEIADLFDSVKEESRANFKDIYNNLEGKRASRKKCQEMLRKYAKTGEIEDMGLDETNSIISVLRGSRSALLDTYIPLKSKPLYYLDNGLMVIAIAGGIVAISSTILASIFSGTDLAMFIFGGYGSFFASAGISSYITSKSNNKLCDSLLMRLELRADSMEAQEETNSKSEGEISENDLFIGLVKDVIAYMKSNPGVDFSEAISRLQQLVSDYKDVTLEEKENAYAFRREELLNNLALIESDVYSKEERIGLKDHLNVVSFSANVLARLDYLGYDVQDIDDDNFLIALMDGINEIASTPFYGCEMEILRFAKVAVSYAQGVLQYGSKKAFRKTEEYSRLLNRCIATQSSAMNRLASSKKYSELASSKEALVACNTPKIDVESHGEIGQESPRL